MMRKAAISACLIAGSSFIYAQEPNEGAQVWESARGSVVGFLNSEIKNGDPVVRGSGYVVENGSRGVYLLTNFHVVRSDFDPRVQFKKEVVVKIEFMRHDIAVHEAVVIGVDPIADLALLHVDPKQLGPVQEKRVRSIRPLQFGDSDSLQFGDWLIGIGNPLMNRRFPSMLVRYSGQGPYTEDRSITLLLNGSFAPGNSGGPVLNQRGDVVGLVTSVLEQGAQSFAVPSAVMRHVFLELRDNKGGAIERMRYATLGVELQELNDELMVLMNLPSKSGAIVTSVGKDSPGAADGNGLRVGDVIVGVNGHRFERMRGARGIRSRTYYSPWDRGDENAPHNAMVYEVIPNQLVREGRASEADSQWKMALFPQRKTWPQLYKPNASVSAPEESGPNAAGSAAQAATRIPHPTGARSVKLRMFLQQTMEGVWVEQDNNDPDSPNRKKHPEVFLRELGYMNESGQPVFKTVVALSDVDDALSKKPRKVLAIFSPEFQYNRHSRVQYAALDVPK